MLSEHAGQALGKVAEAGGHGGVIHAGGAYHAHKAPHAVADIVAGHHHAALLQGVVDVLRPDEDLHGAAVGGDGKLFPGLRTSQAMEKLWEAILATSRVDDDPVAAWAAHNKDLHDRCQYLNSLHIRQLKYRSANGTDLTVGLIPEGQFCGGGETSLQGIFFNPNIPTEECFTSPMKGQAEGIVYSTKPLSYQGQLIDNFWIRFHQGKAVEWNAQVNNELLTKLITMDQGSCYLGECALVPFDSPINQSGLLFYNTLFDENACCHLALGMGFADTIRDFQSKTLDECRSLGVNDSMVHEDFMIGSADLSIDAVCEDGRTVPLFRNGTWAF